MRLERLHGTSASSNLADPALRTSSNLSSVMQHWNPMGQEVCPCTACTPALALRHYSSGSPAAAQPPILTTALSTSWLAVDSSTRLYHQGFLPIGVPAQKKQQCNRMQASVCTMYIFILTNDITPSCVPGMVIHWACCMLICTEHGSCGSFLQGEGVAVEEKPSFSLLDKIRGKRHSSADHPAATPSTPSGKRHPSFELGQIPVCMS